MRTITDFLKIKGPSWVPRVREVLESKRLMLAEVMGERAIAVRGFELQIES